MHIPSNILRRLRATVVLAPICALALAGASSSSFAAVIATVVHEEGFEVDVGDWLALGLNAGIERVASGTNSIPSAGGDWHAEVVGGAYTFFGNPPGARSAPGSEFGFISTIDIYLDVQGGWANDTRADYIVAASSVTGSHLRDFTFNMGFYDDVSGVAGSGSGFIISASPNAGRSNSFPSNPGRDPISITDSGWHTFQHLFQEGADGALEVTMSIIDENGNEMGSWTLSEPSDDFATVFGGSRYGWMANNEFDFLAIDNVTMTVAPEPGKAMLLVVALLGWLTGSRRRSRPLPA